MQTITAIPPAEAKTLAGLFYQRCQTNPDKIAYTHYAQQQQNWHSYTWHESLTEVGKWQQLLQGFSLQKGDRIAIMLNNCPEWVFMEQAALALGLIVVPMYTNDRAENVAYILQDAEVKILLLEDKKQLAQLQEINSQLSQLAAICLIKPFIDQNPEQAHLPCKFISEELADKAEYHLEDLSPDALATIVYTSGTTGRPKGVMLSHKNILSNAWAAISAVPCRNDDRFLSFLPLSHMFERTAGHYIPMMSAAEVAYARSIELLGEDLQIIKPTILVTVPRIFERVHEKISLQLQQKSSFSRFLFKQTVAIGWGRFLRQQHRKAWFISLLFWPLLQKLVAQKVMAKRIKTDHRCGRAQLKWLPRHC